MDGHLKLMEEGSGRMQVLPAHYPLTTYLDDFYAV